jgi:hypothetical protein
VSFGSAGHNFRCVHNYRSPATIGSKAFQQHSGKSMNPYRRAALFLIRLIAFGLILFSLLQVSSYYFSLKTRKKSEQSALAISLKTVPFLIGFILLVKGKSIAKKFTEDLDD